jgi:hypothetical protein
MVGPLAMTRTLSQKIEFVFASLEKLGIGEKQASRLHLLARVFRAEDGSWTQNVPRTDHVRFELAREAWREFLLFEYILDPWPFDSDEVPLGKLRVAVNKDHALQYAQPKNTKGRDTQVELLIATAFRRSGAGAEMVTPPIGLTWPDIRTRACNRDFYIEAKRAKSRRAAVDAIADAVEQVNSTGCPGAAYVDVTMAFNEKNATPNEHLRPDQVDNAFQVWLQEQFEPLRVQIDGLMRGSRLTSVILQCHLLMAIAGNLELRSRILIYPERVTGRYEREDKEIRRTLRQQMPS